MSFLTQRLLTEDQVKKNLPEFQRMQGYPVINNGKRHVWLGLVPIDSEAKSRRADWLRGIAELGRKSTPASDLYESYLTAKTAGSGSAEAPEMVRAVGLSTHAYSILELDSAPGGYAFEQGFHKRLARKTPIAEAPTFGLILVIAASDRQQAGVPDASEEGSALVALDRERKRIDRLFEGLAVIQWEKGGICKGAGGVVRDHFGFQEGLSQPVFFEMPGVGRPSRPSKWDPAAALSYLLTPERDAPNDNEYGSHMAYLKIRQNVDAFRDAVDQMVKAYPGKTSDEIMGWILGRDPQGRALTGDGTASNDFNFDQDPSFNVCPASAHARKVNPRTEAVRNHRILRRSVFYDNGQNDRGTLFQCFQSKLETGFEFVFRDWMLDESHPKRDTGKDAILGEWRHAPVPANVPPAPSLTIQKFAEIQHGEYFYFPSIPFFKRLSHPGGASGAVRPQDTPTENGARFVPELFVPRVRAAVNFYKAVFGAVEAAPRDNQHQQLTLGGHRLFVSAGGAHRRATVSGSHRPGVRIAVLVDDLQAALHRAEDYGARIARPSGASAQTEQALTDPFGHEWLVRQADRDPA